MNYPIYMDNQATTPVDPRVLEAMLPYFKEDFGNAASKNHDFGLRAERAVEEARAKIARWINAQDPSEIVFTSGATESNNMTLKGVCDLYRQKGNHIVTCAIEHKSVIDTCQWLSTRGFRVTFLRVDREGLVDLKELESAISEDTVIVSVMHANNEIGTIQPIAEIGKIARAKGVFFHTDAAQSAGKVPFDVQKMNVDLASLSAHKIYGPKGTGALYVRKCNPRVRLEPLIHGGGHERGLRSGTLNVPAIVGFGKAAEVAEREMGEEAARLLKFREKLRTGILDQLDHTFVNGTLEHRLPGNLNISFAYLDGESVLKAMTQKIAVTSGSACASAIAEPSHVLKELGLPENLIHPSVRFGLGRFTTEEEVDFAIDFVVRTIKALRQFSPLYEMNRLKS